MDDGFIKDKTQLKQLADFGYCLLDDVSRFKSTVNLGAVSSKPVKQFLSNVSQKLSHIQSDLQSVVLAVGDASLVQEAEEIETNVREIIK